jgi:HPt (histidine-containing phosphotransfer) domain-containing protein
MGIYFYAITKNCYSSHVVTSDGSSSQKGDAADAHFHAHSIKGASATIGFDGLSKAAKALDDLVKGGTVEGAMPLIEDLQEQLNLAIEYWEKHTQALANALERCGDDQELFYQIAKEMVQDVIPSQVAISSPAPVIYHAVTLNNSKKHSLNVLVRFARLFGRAG